jgi:hypothetical protein
VRRLQRAIELANQSTEKTENELDNAVDLTAGSRSAA